MNHQIEMARKSLSQKHSIQEKHIVFHDTWNIDVTNTTLLLFNIEDKNNALYKSTVSYKL